MRALKMLRSGGWLVSVLWIVHAVVLSAQNNDEFKLAGPGDIQTERLPATPLVFGAYAIVWIVVTIYVLSLWRRIARTEREVASVAARLEQQRR